MKFARGKYFLFATKKPSNFAEYKFEKIEIISLSENLSSILLFLQSFTVQVILIAITKASAIMGNVFVIQGGMKNWIVQVTLL
jgi:hypothetical protein